METSSPYEFITNVNSSTSTLPSSNSSVLGVLIIIVIIFGAIANLLVILSIASNKKLQHSIDIFIFSHSTSDFLYCLIILPISLNDEMYKHGRNTETLCYVKIILGNTLGGNSLLLYACMALGRYFAIVHHRKFTCFHSKISIVIQIFICWTLPFISTIPLYIRQIFKIQSPAASNSSVTHCSPERSGGHLEQSFLVALNILLPLLIIIICYMFIYSKVIRSRKKFNLNRNTNSEKNNSKETLKLKPINSQKKSLTESFNDSPQSHNKSTLSRRTSNQLKKRELKIASIILAVIIVFIITYIPALTLRLLGPEKFSPTLLIICRIIYPFSMCLYPVIYATLGTRYRRAYMNTLRFIISCDKAVYDYQPSTPGSKTVNMQKFDWL